MQCNVTEENFVAWKTPSRESRLGQPAVQGVNITAESRFGRVRLDISKNNSYILIIEDVRVSDGGDYTCRGSNQSRSFTLEVDCKSCFILFHTFATVTASCVPLSRTQLNIDCNLGWQLLDFLNWVKKWKPGARQGSYMERHKTVCHINWRKRHTQINQHVLIRIIFWVVSMSYINNKLSVKLCLKRPHEVIESDYCCFMDRLITQNTKQISAP